MANEREWLPAQWDAGVYLVRLFLDDEPTPLCKIGFSATPERRARQLASNIRSGFPSYGARVYLELEDVLVVPGMLETPASCGCCETYRKEPPGWRRRAVRLEQETLDRYAPVRGCRLPFAKEWRRVPVGTLLAETVEKEQ
jgi:hypothetical protein